jgi:hypothetical protein
MVAWPMRRHTPMQPRLKHSARATPQLVRYARPVGVRELHGIERHDRRQTSQRSRSRGRWLFSRAVRPEDSATKVKPPEGTGGLQARPVGWGGGTGSGVAVAHNAACIRRAQTSKGFTKAPLSIGPSSRRLVDRVVGHPVERLPERHHRFLARGAAAYPCDPQEVSALMRPRQARSQSQPRAYPERCV